MIGTRCRLAGSVDRRERRIAERLRLARRVEHGEQRRQQRDAGRDTR